MKKQAIFNEIETERERQDKQFGGETHDDKHSIKDWVSYIINFLARAVDKKSDWGNNLKVARPAFIKVCALCIAAIESIDRKMPLALTVKTIEKKVRATVAHHLAVRLDDVLLSASFVKDLDADSLDLVELTMALEEEFDIEISSEDVEELHTVKDVVKYIEEKKIR